MEPWILRAEWRPRVLLIFAIACFYVGVVVINNNLLFSWATDTSYRSWFYPPAGIRLAIIMLLGWAGLLGYFIAALAILYSGIIPEVTQFSDAFFIALTRAASIWAGLLIYGRITGVKHPWEALTWVHLSLLSAFVSLLSAGSVHVVRAILGIEDFESIARGIALNVLGDTLGAVVVLFIVIHLWKNYRQSQRRAVQGGVA